MLTLRGRDYNARLSFIRPILNDYNEKVMEKIAIIFVIGLMLSQGACLTTVPTFSVTNKYIETGICCTTQAPTP